MSLSRSQIKYPISVLDQLVVTPQRLLPKSLLSPKFGQWPTTVSEGEWHPAAGSITLEGHPELTEPAHLDFLSEEEDRVQNFPRAFVSVNSFVPTSLEISCLVDGPRSVESCHPWDIQAPTPCMKLYHDERHSQSLCWELHWAKFWEPLP